MERTFTNRKYLDALKEKVIIFDGAMGTSLQLMNLTPVDFGGERTNGCNDYLVISNPQAVENVHRSFLEVGVDVIETDTFRANRLTLAEYGLADQVIILNTQAAQLAHRVAHEYSQTDHPRFVAGSIGPSGKLPSLDDPELSNIAFNTLVEVFCEQAQGLIDGGVDLLLIETSQDILEVKAAILGIQKAFELTQQSLPIQVQVTLDTTGRMLLGTDAAAFLTILEGLSIDVIGLNCSTGPDYMREPIRLLGELSHLPVSCIPNAGLPLNINGQAVYPLEPQPFAEQLTEFVEKYHINVVGGCCGTTPAHLKLLVEKINARSQAARAIQVVPRLSSAIQAVPMLQEPRPFLIGERLNTQGSQKFKKLMLADDLDGAAALAQEQVESGAHALDLCVALTEQTDEAGLMRKLIKKISPSIRLPLVIDSTELDVMESALQTAPGRCLLNSTNLEAGRKKLDSILSLAHQYNAAVIALTIDEQGMARTANHKLEIAKRIHTIATQEFGLHAHDLVFDALTFTLATGDPEFSQSAIETLEGIRLIKKELPGVLTSLGVSNVSFGLTPAARATINSVMLYHAVQAGLDMAIVNPAQITPYHDITNQERELAENLIFDRHPDALQQIISFYENSGTKAKASSSSQVALSAMTPQERLHWRILHRHKDGCSQDIDAIILPHPPQERHTQAVNILNNTLLPAMKEVGDRFGSGELILPFVLQSAEVMKACVAHLEAYLEKKEGVSKGKLVLATVYGDVHDIGKNLVKTILSNNGFEVIDLGKQVPAITIIEKAIEFNADAIGLSALLVSTSKQMGLIVNELQRRGLSFPVLVGGAAINRRFARRILWTEDGGSYNPGVFYCKDAFEGLSVMEALRIPQQRQELLLEMKRQADLDQTTQRKEPAAQVVAILRSDTPPAQIIPRPPGWGSRVVEQMPLDMVFQHISKNELFRLSWGAKNSHGEEWNELRKEYESRLERMRKEAIKDPWLQPKGIYGYWPALADGNDLVIYEPGSVQAGSPGELMRFTFPRQPDGENLCLADYFLPVGSFQMDTVAFQVVTVGQPASQRFDQLQAENQYSEAYFTHGLAVQMAEAAADFLHYHIQRELGLPPGQGKRYSWGYPAIPDLADHQKVFELLPVESELGITLTSAYQMVPEQSTAAIILHHPLAKYFNIGQSRVDQLTKI